MSSDMPDTIWAFDDPDGNSWCQHDLSSDLKKDMVQYLRADIVESKITDLENHIKELLSEGKIVRL